MLVLVAILVAPVVVLTIVIARSWRAISPDQALVIARMQGEPRVAFTGAIVLPIVHRAEVMDLAMKTIRIERRGKDGVICRDGMRADLIVDFYLRVNRTEDDVRRVAQVLGCARASDPRTLEELFAAKFAEAIKLVARKREFEELYTLRDEVRDEILAVIGRDLEGFVLDDVVIDRLDQTPVEQLDPDNVLDAQGIRKIRELTAAGRLPLARPAPPRAEPVGTALGAELERLGLLDVRITTEVACDVAPDRPALQLQLDPDEALPDQLPAGVSRAVAAAVGRAELRCEAGRATLRWVGEVVDQARLIAGARVVRAMRDDARAYR